MLGKSEPGIGRAPAFAAAGLLAVAALAGLGWSITRSAGSPLKPAPAIAAEPTQAQSLPAVQPQPVAAAPPTTPTTAPTTTPVVTLASDVPQPPRIRPPQHALNDPLLAHPAPPQRTDPSAEPSTVEKPAKPAKININTATAAELELLPGIGPSLAQRIIDYRAKSGRFRTVAELDKVKGIGPKTIEKLRPLVTIE